ncbi:MAG: tetratricopeptide repeat protein [Cyanobacteria bacterium P01_G01_bin.4]
MNHVPTPNKPSKIHYLCPDFEAPSGGIRNLYWHVAQLRRCGLDAQIVHQKANFRLTWHGIDVPTTSLEDNPTLDTNDILVFTEVMLPLMQQMADIPVYKVVLAMSWSPEYYKIDPGDTWKHYGIQAVLTPSVIIADYIRWRMNLPATVIPDWVNPQLYYCDRTINPPYPQSSTSQSPTITYTRRKSHDAVILRSAFEHRSEYQAKFRWQELGTLPEADYAQCLRSSAIYLPPSAREGFNISVLEAMACGCLVVGYHGVGGDEYMVGAGDNQNCILVPNGHLPQYGTTLVRVLRQWSTNPDVFAPILTNAIATAQTYQDRDRQAQQLAEFFTAASNTINTIDRQATQDPTQSPALPLIQQAAQHKQTGNLQDALTCYREALATDPTLPELWFNYGNLLCRLNHTRDAEAAYRQAIHLRDNFYQAHLNLANLLRDIDNPEAAITEYRIAIQQQPDCVLAHRNLTGVLIKLGRSQEAHTLFATWSQLEPDNPVPWNGQGIALDAQGHPERALHCFQQALTLDPDATDTLNNLGTILSRLKRPHDALPHLQRAISLNSSTPNPSTPNSSTPNPNTHSPHITTTLVNLVDTLLKLGRVSEAIDQAEQVLQHHPNSATAALMRGFALGQQARHAEAIDCFDRSHIAQPTDPKAICNALFSMLYRDDLSDTQLFADTRQWAQRLPVPSHAYTHWQGSITPQRPLKIGYLSGDLRSHPVAFFLEPILNHHNTDLVHITCYDTAEIEDATTQRLKQAADRWRKCVSMSDDDLARTIHDDAIDILVDLSGHTSGNRVAVFQRKPAPIQMLYIGYPGTTGIDEMDYIISDALVSPPKFDALYSERVLQVDGSFWCFRPHDFAPAPNPLPAIHNGFITFGSFNNTPKLSPSTLKLWASVLAAVPNSRLKLKALALGDAPTCQHFRQPFIDAGIAPDRILFEGPTLTIETFFEAYHTIDIALDPTPYNGGTTTCETLWMGVPVVTLRGDRFCSRMSHSFLSHVGLSHCSAANPEEYIAIATQLASDIESLQQLRQTLRARMAQSPICDGALAARSLESAYRQAWLNHCQSISSNQPTSNQPITAGQ